MLNPRFPIIFCAVFFYLTTAPVFAVPIDLIKIGTWESQGIGNPAGAGGPDLPIGGKFVMKITYDDASPVTTRFVPDAFFGNSGQNMQSINLQDAGNSLDIFVPMEAFDTTTPFIYQQNQSNHFSFGVNSPVPTLNFANGSDVSNPSNIIGVEFEGDYAAGAGNNLIELFNVASGPASPIAQTGQILNLGPGTIAVSTTNITTDAVAVTVNGGAPIVYDANDILTMTPPETSASATGNDLGAGRSDGEDFLTYNWSVPGTPAADGNNIQVSIVDSGLTMTTSTTSWNVDVTEQMTDLTGSASVDVSYANAIPVITDASATGAVDGYDFNFAFDDLDLFVNTLIAGFEALTTELLVNGFATNYFDSLFNGGPQFISNLDLFNEFGIGLFSGDLTVTDKAGDQAMASFSFNVQDPGIPPIVMPEPTALLLMLLGMFLLVNNRIRDLQGGCANV